ILTTPALEFPRFVTTDPAPYGDRLPLRRGVVHATVDAGALGPVDVLVVHFKSGRGVPLRQPSGDVVVPTASRDYGEANVRAMIWRAAEALFVRGEVDALFAAGKTNVAVLGDFNDVWDSVPVRIVRGGGPAVLHSTGILIDAASRFTVLHNGDKKMIDHVLLSSALRERVQSARILNEELHDHDAVLSDAPRADSDHALVVLNFA
ncbi:MAG TPA: endonuclease/exonuclease/phosphatase family protein, partial [Polyangiaceae bacterium]